MLRFTDDQQAFIRANRAGFNASQTEMATSVPMIGNSRIGNAESLPRDVWQEWDSQAVTIQREELVLFNDLAASVSRTIPIGKIVSNYARIGDSGSVNVSMDGRSKARPDRPSVSYEGVPVPIIDSTFSFGWRAVEAARTEGGMGQLEDGARLNAVYKVAKEAERQILDGSGIEIGSAKASGLRTNSGRATRTTSAALRTATGAVWLTNVKATLALLHARGFKTVTPTMYFNWDDWFYASVTPFDASSANIRTIADVVRQLGINPVAVPSLVASEIIALVKDRRNVTLLTGMPMTTRAQFRASPEDEYVFVTMMAAALQLRSAGAGTMGLAHSTI